VGPTRAGKLERYGTRAAFLSALAAGRYDALLVGRFAGRRDVPEMTWARSVGWRPVADSGRYVMLTPPAGARR
jgi:hypothetical protein